ncbi:MAG: response regulator transcription factor [Bacillota bacterium]|nr:response regulator transcription factor [Bacillota bacterium]
MIYNVLIVEDQDMPRQLFEIYINQNEHFHHIASIPNASGALAICQNQKVDLILMDVMTEHNQSGLDAAKEIKKLFPCIKIIVVTSMPEYSWIERAKKIGVDSFWYKDGQKETILNVMESTMRGENIYPLETPLIPLGNSNNHEFSKKELEILRELSTGDSNAEIGKKLHLATGTVKNYVQHMLEKTGFKTRTELVSEACRLGVVVKNKII